MYGLSVHKGLDIESKRWADFGDVFVVQLLQDRSLPRIVKSSEIIRGGTDRDGFLLTGTRYAFPSLFVCSFE